MLLSSVCKALLCVLLLLLSTSYVSPARAKVAGSPKAARMEQDLAEFPDDLRNPAAEMDKVAQHRVKILYCTS